MDTVETYNLTKEFNGIRAVDGISLKITEGEIFGLLGPNGAGKTTTLKMLSTLINPTSGSARVAGYDIVKEKDKVRENIGMVFQDISLDTELTGRENLDFHARMYNMPVKLREERIKEVLELVDLEDKADIQVKYYSGGMQRRLEIARGLMHYPKVLFLDEPTLGLDAQTRRVLWDYIKALSKREKITIIITTHYMDEADYLCDRVGIIDYGRVVATGKPEELKSLVGEDIISIETQNKNREAVNLFDNLEWAISVSLRGNLIEVKTKNGEYRVPEIIEVAQKAGVKITSLNLRKPTLEDVFIHYTGKTIREREASEKEWSKMSMRMRRRLWGGGRR
jgi:ABC-2 type transport system ATP-binding protein